MVWYGFVWVYYVFILWGFIEMIMGWYWDTDGDLPSGYVKIAIENGHRNGEFSCTKMVMFHINYASLPEGKQETEEFIWIAHNNHRM